MTPYARGLALTALGGFALSFDIVLIRLGAGEAWSTLMLRSALTVLAALAARFAWGLRRGDPPSLFPGRVGVAVAACYGGSSLLFMMAIFNTSTANLVFMLALNTMFAAILSWVFLGERPRPATFAAMTAMVAGVGVIVWDGIGQGRFAGDLMGLGATLLIACAITLTRASGRDMGMAGLSGAALPLVVAAAVVGVNGFTVPEPAWIVLDGALAIPLAFFLLATGPRHLSGPEVAMFYLLETVLAPVWVWLVFGETVSARVLMGGAILIATLVLHSAWQLRQARRGRGPALPAA